MRIDVLLDRGDPFGRRVGKVAEDVHVVEAAERARQVVVDEPQRAAQALETDLHENAGRVLDVVARRLHQPGHLAQLRHDPAGAFGQRCVGEERLAGQAGRENVGIVLGAPLPRPHRLELEEPRTDVGVERRPLQPLDVGQPCRVDGGEAPGEGTELADLCVDRRPAEILEQVVMQVDTVERRIGWMDLVQVREVFVHEVRQGFG